MSYHLVENPQDNVRGKPDERLTFAEAKKHLGIGESTLRNYVRTGQVRAYRLAGGKGRLLYFWKSDLDKLFEEVKPSQADVQTESDKTESSLEAED